MRRLVLACALLCTLILAAARGHGQVPLAQGRDVLVIVGVAGDMESDKAYSDQLARLLDALAAPSAASKSLTLPVENPAALTRKFPFPAKILSNRRESVLSLKGSGPDLVIAWGHGGMQGREPVLHVPGPRLLPADLLALGASAPASGKGSDWVLYFKNSQAFAQVLSASDRRVLASEGEKTLTFDPIGLPLLLGALPGAADLPSLTALTAKPSMRGTPRATRPRPKRRPSGSTAIQAPPSKRRPPRSLPPLLRQPARGRDRRPWTPPLTLKGSPPAILLSAQSAVPENAGLLVNNRSGVVRVQISDEQEMRVLFVQGTLTWDYKFINKALHGDPSVHLTGLSRTSDKSVYRQNVETEGELLGGFPTTLEQAAHFRVIALSNLKASDLTATQQDVLTRFCGKLGGGVLMLGGPGTFDASWKDSALEKLLPVVFDPAPGLTTLEKAFQLRLTPAASRHPVFQITDSNLNAAAWAKLPPFLQYGRVAEAKAGATVWAEHDADTGPNGRKRILMAA